MLSLPSHILDDQHYSLNKFLVQRSIRSIWTNEDSLASSTSNSIWLTRIFLEVLAQTIWIKHTYYELKTSDGSDSPPRPAFIIPEPYTKLC